jgi:hypothetical protein
MPFFFSLFLSFFIFSFLLFLHLILLFSHLFSFSFSSFLISFLIHSRTDGGCHSRRSDPAGGAPPHLRTPPPSAGSSPPASATPAPPPAGSCSSATRPRSGLPAHPALSHLWSPLHRAPLAASTELSCPINRAPLAHIHRSHEVQMRRRAPVEVPPPSVGVDLRASVNRRRLSPRVRAASPAVPRPHHVVVMLMRFNLAGAEVPRRPWRRPGRSSPTSSALVGHPPRHPLPRRWYFCCNSSEPQGQFSNTHGRCGRGAGEELLFSASWVRISSRE